MSMAREPDQARNNEAPTVQRPPIHAHLRRTLIAACLFALALLAYFTAHFISFPTPLPEIALASTAAMAVHLLDRLWLFRDTAESFDQLREQIIGNISANTTAALARIQNSIQKSTKSLEAMQQSELSRVYSDRSEASQDIFESIKSPQNQKVRLIGVSLNDFILRKDPNLGNAWTFLRERVEKDDALMDIKLLVIDPLCFGAQLRSKGEERLGDPPGRLSHDLNIVIDAFLRLERSCKQKNVKFECRVYRLPPILFLCLTDAECYAQQYYFWSTRDDSISFPVLRFQSTRASTGPTIHAELDQHFNWIWEQASIELSEYRNSWSLGADRSIAEVGIVNVFSEQAVALKRIQSLLERAKQRVSIQGISLHSFFMRSNPELYQVISSLIMNDNVDVELLLLDPECEQAVIRGYREWSFDNAGAPRERYSADGGNAHRRSLLFMDTQSAKSTLERMVRDIAERKPPGWAPRLKAGFYKSAPHCFMLRVDDLVLIEQYHYGKLPDREHGARVILGKDLPLIEYTKSPASVFEHTKKLPFALLESHFDFALQEASLFPVEEWATTTPRAGGGTATNIG